MITKVAWKETKKAFERTLHDLQLAYIDLYLLHIGLLQKLPKKKKILEKDLKTWRTFEELYEEEKSSNDVNNFIPHHLKQWWKKPNQTYGQPDWNSPAMLQTENSKIIARMIYLSVEGMGTILKRQILKIVPLKDWQKIW